jgi:hypothetical protein
MGMEREDSLFDLNLYRNQKQLLAEKNAKKLYSMVEDYAIRYANIREKVRAKHLFRQQIQSNHNGSLPKYLEDIFDQWFLFDYHTIQGETMFSLFLKQRSSKLSEPEMILGALFLTTFVEPYEIIEIDEEIGTMFVRGAQNNKLISMKSVEGFDLIKGEYIFVRRLPLITKDWIIGPIFHIQSRDFLDAMLDEYEFASKSNSSLTWRTYLKKQGYFLLAQILS